ncbi:YeeE/YedE family protein [bacterium]|nr:YeeE/YedE family protein [bacterium]
MARQAKAERQPARYWDPYLAGAILGLVLFATFAVTGHGLGASGGMARLIAAAEGQLAPDHVQRNPELATAVGGAGHPLDHWLVWMLVGVFIGGLVSGLLAGRFRLTTFHGPQITPRSRWALALIGGTLVGFGARMARGCTSGQALSGGAVLSVGSFVFMLSVFAGGYLLAYLFRRVWN